MSRKRARELYEKACRMATLKLISKSINNEPNLNDEPEIPYCCGTMMLGATPEELEKINRYHQKANTKWLAWYVCQSDELKEAKTEKAKQLGKRLLIALGHTIEEETNSAEYGKALILDSEEDYQFLTEEINARIDKLEKGTRKASLFERMTRTGIFAGIPPYPRRKGETFTILKI